MRISDWSSDVCSSDLSLDDGEFCRALGDASERVLGEIAGCTRRVSFPLGVQHAETYVAPCAVLVGDAAHVIHPPAEIGRAPCRERVRQFVVIAEVAGAFKQQQTNTACTDTTKSQQRNPTNTQDI